MMNFSPDFLGKKNIKNFTAVTGVVVETVIVVSLSLANLIQLNISINRKKQPPD